MDILEYFAGNSVDRVVRIYFIINRFEGLIQVAGQSDLEALEPMEAEFLAQAGKVASALPVVSASSVMVM